MLQAAGGPARFNLAQLRKAMAGAAPGHRGGWRRPRCGRRHRDGRGRGRCRRRRGGGSQPGADRGSQAGRPDPGAGLKCGEARPGEHNHRSGRRHAGVRGGVQRPRPAGGRPQRHAGDPDAGLAGPRRGDAARDRPGRPERGRGVHGNGRGGQPGLRQRQRRSHRRRYAGAARRPALRPGRRRPGGRRDMAALLRGLFDGCAGDGVSRRRRLHGLRADRGPGLRHQRQRQRRRGRHLVERRRRLGADRRRRRTLHRGLRRRRPYGGQPVHRPLHRGRGGPVRGRRPELDSWHRPDRCRRDRRRCGRQPAGGRRLCVGLRQPCHGQRVGPGRGGRPRGADLGRARAQLRCGGRVRRAVGGRAGGAPDPQQSHRQLCHGRRLGYERGRRAGRGRERLLPEDSRELCHR